MDDMKVAKNFILQEFVPPEIFHRFGKEAIWFIRPQVIKLAQFYRDWFDAAVTVNTWHDNGNMHWRGFRTPACGVGAHLSQHRFGNAFDCTIEGLTPDEVRKEILDNEDKFMRAGLTTLEDGAIAKTWVHSDCRTTKLDHILIVRP